MGYNYFGDTNHYTFVPRSFSNVQMCYENAHRQAGLVCFRAMAYVEVNTPSVQKI